jgi:hypothetical protein
VYTKAVAVKTLVVELLHPIISLVTGTAPKHAPFGTLNRILN